MSFKIYDWLFVQSNGTRAIVIGVIVVVLGLLAMIALVRNPRH